MKTATTEIKLIPAAINIINVVNPVAAAISDLFTISKAMQEATENTIKSKHSAENTT